MGYQGQGGLGAPCRGGRHSSELTGSVLTGEHLRSARTWALPALDPAATCRLLAPTQRRALSQPSICLSPHLLAPSLRARTPAFLSPLLLSLVCVLCVLL